MKKIGLVAGRGRLPLDALEDIQSRGAIPVVVGLKGEVGPELASRLERCTYEVIAPGQLRTIIETFKNNAVEEVVFAGKIGKQAIFAGGLDEMVQRLLGRLTHKNDDAILLGLVEEFQNHGITVARQTDYLRKLLAPTGAICGGALTAAEDADLQLGFKMAKAIGALDIGQSVVVKQGVVLAVEAMEGTDQAIMRGGAVGGPGATVVKVSKPQQDERFDVPTIGRSTIESMVTAGATLLGIEAGKTLITGMAELKLLADEKGIKIYAISG